MQRDGPPPAVRDFLKRQGDKKITHMYIGRTPIHSAINTFLNALSFGALNKTRKKLGYDDIYHNYLLVRTSDGRLWKLEKNHVVRAVPASSADTKNEIHSIPVDKDIDINTLISTASRGDKEFWKYNPRDKNCQWFAKDIIVGNNLDKNVDNETREVIQPQSGDKLLDSLGALKEVPKGITDFASGLDTLVYGQGIKKKITVDQLFDLANK